MVDHAGQFLKLPPTTAFSVQQSVHKIRTNWGQLSTRLSSKTFSPSSAGYSRGREAEKLSAEIWNSSPGLVSQIPDFGP